MRLDLRRGRRPVALHPRTTPRASSFLQTDWDVKPDAATRSSSRATRRRPPSSRARRHRRRASTGTTLTLSGRAAALAGLGGLSGAIVRIVDGAGAGQDALRTITANTAQHDHDRRRRSASTRAGTASTSSSTCRASRSTASRALVGRQRGARRPDRRRPTARRASSEGGDTDTYSVGLTHGAGAPSVDGRRSGRSRRRRCATRTTRPAAQRVQVTVDVARRSSPPAVPRATPTARSRCASTPANWSDSSRSSSRAIDDNYADGCDLQAFPDRAQRMYLIQGPLYVFGGNDPRGRPLDRRPPVMLPGRDAGHRGHARPPRRCSSIETKQVDTLNVYNEDSISDDVGDADATRLTGLGMGGDQFVAGRSLPGGITYGDLEALEHPPRPRQRHASRSSRRTSAPRGSRAATRRAVRARRHFFVRTIDGHTTIEGRRRQRPRPRRHDGRAAGAGTIDEIAALLTIDGGAGNDTRLARRLGRHRRATSAG